MALQGKRSFFTELLISFLLLLCIPIITIVLILWQSNRIVKEQVLAIESKSLHLYVEQLEEVMEGMKDVCHTLYASEYCQLYASQVGSNSKWAYDLRTKVVNTLQSLDKSSYYDVFVYYNSDRIISSRYASLKAADYYATYYSDLKINSELRDDFINILTSDYKKPKCHVINAGTENAYLCMTMVVKGSAMTRTGYTVCVVLDPSYLQQLLVMQKGNEDSSFMVYNVDKEMMFSNNLELEEEYLGDVSSWETAKVDEWHDAKDYMMQVKHSAVLDNYYVYTVSKDLFWNTLWWLRMWGYAGAGLCVLVSILFAYRSAVRAYQPVGNIMELLKRKTGANSQEKIKSEFSHIISFMEEQEKALKENKQINRAWFLHGILEGKEINLDAQTLEKNNIAFVSDQFVVCIIEADVLNANVEELCSFIVQNVLEELCDSIGKGYFVELSRSRYALLVNLSSHDKDLSGVLQYGQEFLQEKMQIILSVGYSDVHKGIAAVSEAYREALEAIRYRFLLGRGRLIAYKDIKARSNSYRNDEESKVYLLLLEYMENKKEEDDLENFVEQLMYIYQMNEEMSMDVALVFKNEIVSAVAKMMELCGYEEENIRSVRSAFKNTGTLSDFRQLLSVRIAELCKHKIKRKASVDILEETKRFIKEYYSDNELSVASIGSSMGMQGNHLSKIFKERYEITLLDYLANVRIREAKRLIEEGKLSVQEVAEKTGFLSSTVFIRTFKKKEGITPGKYKEMMEKGK